MSYIVFGSVALGSYLLYKYVKNENINFTMSALKAHSLLKENKLYKSVVNFYNNRETKMVIGIEFKLNNELFIIQDRLKFSIFLIKDKIIEISGSNLNKDLNDIIVDIKWTQYDKVYRTRIKYSDLDNLELPELTDKLYKDYILTGYVTIKNDNKININDVTDLLNEYAGPNGDFFKDYNLILNDPINLFTKEDSNRDLYYMDYRGQEFNS